jgi:hypothetical protein
MHSDKDATNATLFIYSLACFHFQLLPHRFRVAHQSQSQQLPAPSAAASLTTTLACSENDLDKIFHRGLDIFRTIFLTSRAIETVPRLAEISHMHAFSLSHSESRCCFACMCAASFFSYLFLDSNFPSEFSSSSLGNMSEDFSSSRSKQQQRATLNTTNKHSRQCIELI